MILFFLRGRAESDLFIKYCYGYYRDITSENGVLLPKDVEIVREEGQKPKFKNAPAYFNLSHTDGVTLLGISHSEIGVDVEKIRPIEFEKFKFIDAQSLEQFFEKWTERESYLKFSGEGISGFRREIPSDAHFEHFPVYDCYHACVCAEEQNIIAYEIDINALE